MHGRCITLRLDVRFGAGYWIFGTIQSRISETGLFRCTRYSNEVFALDIEDGIRSGKNLPANVELFSSTLGGYSLRSLLIRLHGRRSPPTRAPPRRTRRARPRPGLTSPRSPDPAATGQKLAAPPPGGPRLSPRRRLEATASWSPACSAARSLQVIRSFFFEILYWMWWCCVAHR